jgi:hypothetical protein
VWSSGISSPTAFLKISRQGQDLVADPDTPAGRKALPLHYYSTNLTRFIGIKRSYDPGNFLDFEMGIPTR